jgi:hypothetical protein
LEQTRAVGRFFINSKGKGKMNIFGKTRVLLFLAAVMIVSCNSSQSTSTVSDAEIMETATVSTTLAETQRAIPTKTPLPLPTVTPTPTSLPPSPTATPPIPLSERIIYYYLVEHAENPIPQGAIHARFSLIAPTYADETYTSDTAADLRTALELVLHDERNDWLQGGLEAEIVDVTVRNGHAQVLLQGRYSTGDSSRYVPLAEASMQILLTVFANPTVETAAISLNDDTIGNLGISDSSEAKPANYVFTRAEMETYLKEQAYVAPTPTPTSTPLVVVDSSIPLPELLPDAIDHQWITVYDLPGDQFATKVHPTRDGGFILVGNTVLLKLRADGYIEWQKSLRPVTALDALETSTGDFILAGDGHWIKLDSQGDLLWQYTFERPSYHTGPILRLVEESNGNIVVEAAGSQTVFNADGELQSFTEYAMQWDSQTYPDNVRDRSGETLWAGGEEGSFQYWVGKADLNNGWLKVFLSPDDYDIGPLLFIQTTADGGAIVGVPLYDYPDPHLWFSYVLISRLSGDGSVRWQKVYDSHRAASHENFHAFETRSGDFIVAGTLVDFGEGGDVWMARLDRDGNSRWVKVYGTEGEHHRQRDAVAVIQELSNGDLIFAGHTNRVATGGQNMWILKTNAQGEIPNCGYALEVRSGELGGDSPELETIALEGVSVRERETIPGVEEEQSPFGDAEAQVIPLCLPSP